MTDVQNPKPRLVCLTSHPIQYQAPLFREIAASPDLELVVLFCSDVSVRPYFDREFNRQIAWDVPLLTGYDYRFLPTWGRRDRISFFRPLNYGLASTLDELKPDALWITAYARWTYWVAVALAKARGIRVFISGDVSPISAQRGLVKRVLKRLFFLSARHLCDAFLSIGTLNREYYRSQGVPSNRLVRFPFAVDNHFFQSRSAQAAISRNMLRDELRIPQQHPVIVYAAKFIPKKRPQDLLHAFIGLSRNGVTPPSATLLLIGDGELRQELEKQADRLNWSNIKFLGFKNQTELPAYFDLCDLFVLPSEVEPWGLVVNEAMNARCAILVSDKVGCAPDLVHPGKNGAVFRARDVEDLRRTLERLLEDRNKLQEMGEESLRIINSWSFAQDVAALRVLLREDMRPAAT